MGEVVSLRLKPFHYPREVIAHPRPAEVFRLSEHRSLVFRYQDSCRQADVLNASLGELWLRAYLASINYALVIAGVAHAHQHGREEHSCRKETLGQNLAPGEGQ